MSCWQIPDGVGDRVGTQVALHELAEKLDDRPRAREQADALHLSDGILCYEDGDLDRVTVDAPVECDDVSAVGVLELIDVAGHPIASKCCLKDLDYNGVPADLIAGCRQDRRMKDNVLIESSYRGGKIASFQRGREDSLCHSVTPRLWDRVKGDRAPIAAHASAHAEVAEVDPEISLVAIGDFRDVGAMG
jgi:hypothetical protein